jgi:hypothetical protein
MNWQPREKDIKTYLHFDASVPTKQLVQYVSNPKNVEKHRFFPLIRFHEKWTKFRKDGRKKRKIRPLRYAARKDAAIFAYYRCLLSDLYEKELAKRNISHIPIAYRQIPKGTGAGNKCNIELARDAFDRIRELGDVDVTVVDISSYFEHLDHDKIKDKWEMLIGRKLNLAEQRVFNALTSYSVVDRHKVFERLNLFESRKGKNRTEKRKRKIDKLREKNWRRVCTGDEFRAKICGGDPKLPSLIQKNTKSFGIPQGTPISDLIANFYLIDFDQKLSRWVKKKGGYAFRYSDDIIVILPRTNGQDFNLARVYLQQAISLHGNELKIQNEKVAVGRFISVGEKQVYTHIYGNSSQNGLEYLGFEYDGFRVKIKNSTLSNAWRKLKKRCYGWARRYVRRYRAKGDIWLIANAPLKFETERIIKIGSVKEKDFKKWTFNRYVKRCEIAFKKYDVVFANQTKKYRKTALRVVMNKAFDKAIAIHGSQACRKKGIRL